MRTAGEVLVVGSINIDLVVRAQRLPAPGETVSGGAFARHHGGKGANQAVAAARLAAAVTMVGAVGDDEFGQSALADLRAEGIDTSRITVLGDAATGVALIVVDERGENQIAVASGANAALDGDAVERALSGFEPRPGGVALLSFELGDSAIVAAARIATAHGMSVVLNPSPARALPPELLALGPILIPNEGEAVALAGGGTPEAAALALANKTGAPVIVTLGADGALLAGSNGLEGVQHIPAQTVQVVDTTGAGDAFAGALAAELAAGSALAEAARVAVLSAGLSVTVAGAREGMPTRAALG